MSISVQTGKLWPLPIPMYPFEKVTMDLINYLPCVSTGYNSVCNIVDQWLKYVYFALYTETIFTEGLSYVFLHTILARHVMPRRIILHHGTRLTIRFWSALVFALECEHAKPSSHHPETDG